MLDTTLLDPAATARLSPQDASLFAEQGFLRLESIMPLDEVAQTRATLERLFDTRVGYAEGARFDFLSAEDDPDKPVMPQILRPSVFAPELLQGVAATRAGEIARQLLGPDARLTFDHVLMKPAHDGAATPWHQDDAFADPDFEMRSVSIWMPLQAVNEQNGCLAFIPGDPARAVLEHRPPGEKVHGLECISPFDLSSAVACPLPAGGCTLHTGRTLHGAGANLSDAPRYAFVLVFSTPKRAVKQRDARPWLDNRETARDQRERAWRRKGGMLPYVWRRLRSMPISEYPTLAVRVLRRVTRR